MRIKKQYQKGFTTVDNVVLNDTNLSWKAKGLFVYLWSQADEWDFYETEVAKHSTDKVGSLKSGLKELEQQGYLKRKRTRDEKGKFIGNKWILSDNQMFKNPTLDNPTLDNPMLENHTLTNTNNNNINNNKDESISAKENKDKKSSNENNKYNFDYKKFFDFFKETTGKRYTATNNNKKLINARLNEGATKQDFYLITKHKAIQWKDNDMNKWLKPSTLFIPKHFEDYLNEAEAYFSAEPQKKKEESSAKEEKRKVDPIDEQIHRGKLFLEKFPDNEKVRKEIERLERNRNENRGDTAQ